MAVRRFTVSFAPLVLLLGVLLAAVGPAHGQDPCAGAIPIRDVQGPGDESPLLGEEVIVRGVVTFETVNPRQFFLLSDFTPPRNGIYVGGYEPRFHQSLRVGDEVCVRGTVFEAQRGGTGIDAAFSYERIGERALPDPTTVTAAQIAPDAPTLEDVESVRVRVEDVEVVDGGSPEGGTCFGATLDDGTATFQAYLGEYPVRCGAVGDRLAFIQGSIMFFMEPEFPVLMFVVDNAGAGQGPAMCRGLEATITGTSGDDVLLGTDDRDVIAGLGGDDQIQAFGANDLVCGGDGEDVIEGGTGQDRLYGDADDDDLRGGPGNDGLNGGAGDDVLDGGANNDLVRGDAGDDVLSGGLNDDWLQGGPGRDVLRGGNGNDLLEGGAADDELFGEAHDDRLLGNDGNDLLDGSTGRDVLRGGPGDDELSGGGGDDELHGALGDDLLDGGPNDDLLRGNRGDDTLLARGGDDVLQGGPDDDVLDGGPQTDTADGGTGTDACTNAETMTACEGDAPSPGLDVVARVAKISATQGGFTGGLSPFDLFGSSVAAIGDQDGDGNVDLSIGSFDDDGGFNTGAVWTVLLKADGSVRSQQKISDTTGGLPGDLVGNGLFGFSTASAGDLDGDGRDEVVVGNLGDDTGGPDHGAAWVLSLDASSGAVAWSQKISDLDGGFTGVLSSFDRFGTGVTGIGDLDGDGVRDLAVGAPDTNDGGTDRGAVWILFMQDDGTVRSHQKISDTAGGLTDPLADADRFGFEVAGIGDLDGDGNRELAVHGRIAGPAGQNVGAVWILFLADDGTVTSSQRIDATNGGFPFDLAPVDGFGSGLTGMGDLDGDGVDDMAIGARWHDTDELTDSGAVWLVLLNADGTVKDAHEISAVSGGLPDVLDDEDSFGASLASLDDLDGDGMPELVVGAVGDDDGGSSNGAVWILFLDTSGLAAP